MILTGCGLPIPEEVAIVMAGVLSAQGTLDVWAALASCLVGALVGDIIVYGIGYHFGHSLLKDHPRFARFLRADREAQFEEKIERHGMKVLLLARFMVGVRSPVYLASGILRIPFRRFVLMDLVCATLVVGVSFGLSYAFGEQIIRAIRRAQISISVAVVAITGMVALLYYLRRRRNTSSTKKSTETPTPHEEQTVHRQKQTVG